MKTMLFEQIVFGPIKSRRLGISLGVNLLPVNGKLCNFDCIYCECGLNKDSKGLNKSLPSREDVFLALKEKLTIMHRDGEAPDVITFAGNGEPTMHPNFADIISDTLLLRDQIFPKTLVSVLSNATMLHKSDVVEALKTVDQNILKLDSGNISTIHLINQPVGIYDLDKIKTQLKQFNGKLIIQTMFTRGSLNEIYFDNTSEEDLQSWEDIVVTLNPQKIMIYTIDRNTPVDGLEKIPVAELKKIAARIEKHGISVQVSG
jgi:wyosine [tRNA(Phe)-imidazoG37] synthetase (radical SAM superfamily)